ncbi:hypothetical protein [Actinomadura rudentiformis]|nr:hypothetical protein [Actinomadura rudentiformis]
MDTCYISTKVKNPAGNQRWTVATVGLAATTDVGFGNAGPLQLSA